MRFVRVMRLLSNRSLQFPLNRSAVPQGPLIFMTLPAKTENSHSVIFVSKSVPHRTDMFIAMVEEQTENLHLLRVRPATPDARRSSSLYPFTVSPRNVT